MDNKKLLIQTLEGVIQEIKAETLKVDKMQTTATINLKDRKHKDEFNLFIKGHYSEEE